MRNKLASALIIGMVFALTPALADPPPGKGGGKSHRDKGNKQGEDRERASERSERRAGPPGGHFADEHRVYVREYYDGRHRSGKCPPGLAKKNNGCMPPGQAKKWRLARPLPPDVVYYSVPPALVVKLGAPPPGHRYVRVAADILMIAVGTGMVVDAIQDLGRM